MISGYNVLQACQALGCMEHRGACSADNDSGDGSGIMTQIPWDVIEESVGVSIKRETTGYVLDNLSISHKDSLQSRYR